jgi:hypothetical protein
VPAGILYETVNVVEPAGAPFNRISTRYVPGVQPFVFAAWKLVYPSPARSVTILSSVICCPSGPSHRAVISVPTSGHRRGGGRRRGRFRPRSRIGGGLGLLLAAHRGHRKDDRRRE